MKIKKKITQRVDIAKSLKRLSIKNLNALIKIQTLRNTLQTKANFKKYNVRIAVTFLSRKWERRANIVKENKNSSEFRFEIKFN